MVRKISVVAFFSILMVSCGNWDARKNKENVRAAVSFPDSYTAVGDDFSAEEILSSREMNEQYEKMKVGDTLQVRFKSTVNSVCKNKGCWMKVELANGNEAMVKFKDYAFFVPKDIEEREVVMKGFAFVDVMSVEDQQHFAEDAGKSPGEVSAITTPKKTLSFLAEGVVIEEQ